MGQRKGGGEREKSDTLTIFKCGSLQSISPGTNFDATLPSDNMLANLDVAQKEDSAVPCFAGANTFKELL